MSLAKFFGFGKNEKSITPGEAIQKLRDTEEMLCKKQDFLEKKIDQEISLAKQHGSKNKRGNVFRINVFFQEVTLILFVGF